MLSVFLDAKTQSYNIRLVYLYITTLEAFFYMVKALISYALNQLAKWLSEKNAFVLSILTPFKRQIRLLLLYLYIHIRRLPRS